MTTPEKWEAVKVLFEAALEQESAQRSSFLLERCGDVEVRSEVERLLTEHEHVGSFLSTPVLKNLNVDGEVVEPSQRISAGELLAGRFRVVRFIACGGMGEVYEAEDEELRERVAIKMIRPEILIQPNAVVRFRREVHLARMVTNFNVCRIFDLFRHKPADAHDQEIAFISMELLHGKHLGEIIKERGRINPDKALPLIRQMGRGLAAAHAAKVVHRDFKPQNVILTPIEGSQTPRAVITDFGLALQSATSGEPLSNYTAHGLFGTPAYMSPEQIEGKTATSASDIYAFGLVIYEMVTGNRPFVGDTPISAAMKRLSEAPALPRSFNPGLSRTWEDTILRCLARNPSERFSNAEDVAKALAGEPTVETPIGRMPAFLRQKRWIVVALSLLIVPIFFAALAVGIFSFRHRGPGNDAEKATAPGQVTLIVPRPSVAVLGFKNLSGRLEETWLSTTLAETIDTELAVGEHLRTIPRENITRMKNDLALPDAVSYAPDTLQRIRNNLGTDFVIEGAYVALGRESRGQIRVDVRLQDTRSGETVASVVESGSESELNDLFTKAGADLRARLGVVSVSDQDEAAGRASLPTNSEAARNYAEGIDKLRKFDFLGARGSFEHAVAAESHFALGHLALGTTWAQLYYDAKAKNEVRIAFDLSTNLSREDRLNIEARLREANRERDRAVEIYRSLFTFYPDNVDYGLHLANAQCAAGKEKDALVTVRSLRALPPPLRDDPRIDLAEENADYYLGDAKDAQLLAAQAAEKALKAGSPALFARARSEQGSAFRLLGKNDEALLAFGDAERFYLKNGDRGALNRVLLSSAIVYKDEGKLAEAKSQLEEGLRIAEEIGDTLGGAAAADNLAIILETQGDLEGAKTSYELALKGLNELGNKNDVALVLAGLGNVLASEGDLNGAVSKYQKALALGRETGDAQSIQYDSYALATQWARMGRLEEADRATLQALEYARKIGNNYLVGCDLSARAELFIDKGDLKAARKLLEDAMELAQVPDQKPLAAAVQLDLGLLSIEEGHSDSAIPLLKDAISEFQSQKDDDDEANAWAILSRSYLAQNKIPDARESIKQAEATLRRGHFALTELDLAIIVARTNAASGSLLEAKSSLKHILDEAAKMQCVECQFDARLALGEIELKSDTAAGREHLLTLQRDAGARGFLLIAHKAAGLSRN